MLKNKKTAFCLVGPTVVAIAICMGLFFNSSKLSGEVDLSDIEEMNIGVEIPRFLYGDKRIAVIQGTFGLFVYNIED